MLFADGLLGRLRMIRALLGLALPVFGIGLSAAFVAPSLVSPQGEPMLVTASDREAQLQQAGFDPAVCEGLTLVALTFRSAPDGLSVRFYKPDLAPEGVLLLVLDGDGEVVGASPAEAVGAPLAAGCHGGGADKEPGTPGAI
jgi:hypothetical protein